MLKMTKEKIRDNWYEFTISNQDMSVSFLNFGGIITKIMVPDRFNHKENIVLCYQDYSDYEQNPYYLGAIIGRVAGRIKNASVQINGSEFALDKNEHPHHLHGGKDGFHHVLWDVKSFHHEDGIGVVFTYMSPDGEGGYPGNLNVAVTYTLTNNNQFQIDYEATTDKETILTLTNHSYFNLSGNLKNTVDDHEVTIDSKQVIELDKDLIPLKIIKNVADTEFDFRKGRLLHDGFVSQNEQNQLVGNGYDHYFLFEKAHANEVLVKDRASGRVMKIQTDEAGLVMYTSNTMDQDILLNDGHISKNHLGVCFEAQSPPASLWIKGLPPISLLPNEPYKKQTRFSFEIKK